MATTDIGVGKSIAVLAVVVGCFTVLWPKIFYPMMQAAFSLTWPSHDEHGGDRSSSVSADPRRLRLQEAMGQARPADQSREYRKGRPFPHMSARQPPRQPTKTGGAMNLVMPLYTMGVVVFFLYTVLKVSFVLVNKNSLPIPCSHAARLQKTARVPPDRRRRSSRT